LLTIPVVGSVARIVAVPTPTAPTRLLSPGVFVATATVESLDEYTTDWVRFLSVPPAKWPVAVKWRCALTASVAVSGFRSILSNAPSTVIEPF